MPISLNYLNKNEFSGYFTSKSNPELISVFLKHRGEPFLDPIAYSALLDVMLTRKFSPEEKEIVDRALNEDDIALEQISAEWDARNENKENPLMIAGISFLGMANMIWFYIAITIILGLTYAIVHYQLRYGPGYMEEGLEITAVIVMAAWLLFQAGTLMFMFRELKKAGHALLEAGRKADQP